MKYIKYNISLPDFLLYLTNIDQKQTTLPKKSSCSSDYQVDKILQQVVETCFIVISVYI